MQRDPQHSSSSCYNNEYYPGCDHTVVTGSTASTSSSLRSIESSLSSSLSPTRWSHSAQSQSSVSSPTRKLRVVRWKDLTSNKNTSNTATSSSSSSSSNNSNNSMQVDLERLSFEDCLQSNRNKRRHRPPTPPPSAKKLKQRKRELFQLEAKIQKSAKLELEYLNEAKHVSTKRDSWTKSCQKLQDRLQEQKRTLTDLQIEQAQLQIAHIQNKIKKAQRMETIYLKKSKELRSKRYRWTQLYELTRKEVEPFNSRQHHNKPLPPLWKQSSSSRMVVDAS